MKLWALAGLVAGAAIVTVFVRCRHRAHPASACASAAPSEADDRYAIDELLMQADG